MVRRLKIWDRRVKLQRHGMELVHIPRMEWCTNTEPPVIPCLGSIQQLGHQSHVLAFTDISSALGWIHKASFESLNEGFHYTVAQWLGWTLVSNKASLYSQHIKVTKNVILDSLLTGFNILDQSLTKKSTPFYHIRQRHHYISNFHPEILSPGYFH